mmetsp:Transcript_7779/g.11768  ORF Transcript_7779/g.11768 Transcript_7779/m.11768 type:complete len:151 (+) Transcript_7779:55-507(+)
MNRHILLIFCIFACLCVGVFVVDALDECTVCALAEAAGWSSSQAKVATCIAYKSPSVNNYNPNHSGSRHGKQHYGLWFIDDDYCDQTADDDDHDDGWCDMDCVDFASSSHNYGVDCAYNKWKWGFRSWWVFHAYADGYCRGNSADGFCQC